MTERKGVETVTPAEYNDVIGQAQLIDIKLIKGNFNVEPAFFAADPDDLMYVADCDLETRYVGEESSTLMGFYACEAGAKKSRKWLLRIRATYLVAYHVVGKPSEAAAAAYLERVGKFACFPYFRSHVAQVAASAGAELPPLPVLKEHMPRRIGGAKTASAKSVDA